MAKLVAITIRAKVDNDGKVVNATLDSQTRINSELFSTVSDAVINQLKNVEKKTEKEIKERTKISNKLRASAGKDAVVGKRYENAQVQEKIKEEEPKGEGEGEKDQPKEKVKVSKATTGKRTASKKEAKKDTEPKDKEE